MESLTGRPTCCVTEPHGHAQGELSPVDTLLLEVAAHIREPDGIYAAARTPAPAPQLRLAEHEGAWDVALLGYDLGLRSGGGGGIGAIPSGDEQSAQQDGLANALQQLGCLHTLRAYCAGLPPGSTAGMPACSPSAAGSARTLLRQRTCLSLHVVKQGLVWCDVLNITKREPCV